LAALRPLDASPADAADESIGLALMLILRWHVCTRGGLPGLGIPRRSALARMIGEGA